MCTFACSGGEPLLKPGLKEILLYVKGKKCREAIFDEALEFCGYKEVAPALSLITNGELINEEWVTILKECGAVVTVSLPGINSFKELTNSGDYRKALSAIHLLSDVGIDVVVSVCVSKKNLWELFETISLGFLNGAGQLLLNRFLPGGRGLDYPELCLNREEIVLMLDIAEHVCRESNTFGSVGTELPRCILGKEYKMLKVGTLCSGGKEFFAVDPSGKVRPCNHSSVRVGDFKDIDSAIETDYWQRFMCKDFLPKECSGCMLSLQCDGGCREAAHIVGGSLASKDPLLLEEDLCR